MTAADNIRVSCIIPARDHADTLRTLLGTLHDLGPSNIPYEVIVVDDGSRERLEALCREYRARCVRLESGQGPAAARNTGASVARGEVLLFLDADVEYPAGLMETALNELDGDPALQAVAFLNQPYDPEDTAIKNYGAVLEHYWFTALFTDDAGRTVVHGFTTRNGFVRKAAFDDIGGFDTSFTTNALEDYDIGKRLAARHKVVLLREPTVYHNYPSSLVRVLRNCFVRASLWVGYYLRRRPPLDPVQTSAGEGILRMIGCAIPLLLGLALLPVEGRPLWVLLAAAALGYYVVGLRHFLRQARQRSGRLVFPMACFIVHYLSSFAIVLGVAWGLCTYIARRGPRNRKRASICSAGENDLCVGPRPGIPDGAE